MSLLKSLKMCTNIGTRFKCQQFIIVLDVYGAFSVDREDGCDCV